MKSEFLNKKINMADMANVSGGDALETADDSRFLNVVLQGRSGRCDRYGEPSMRLGNHDQEVARAWAAVGVKAEIHTGNFFTSGDDNRYYINGTELTRKVVMQHAMMITGRNLKKSDWFW